MGGRSRGSGPPPLQIFSAVHFLNVIFQIVDSGPPLKNFSGSAPEQLPHFNLWLSIPVCH